jgi:outer membrane protein assembly factor BamB
MKKLYLVLTLACSLFIFLSPSLANIWWVDLNGNNNNSGSVAAPLRSIQTAIDKAASGDTVILKQGAFLEQLTLKPSKSLTITSQYLITGDTAFIHNTIIGGFKILDSLQQAARNQRQVLYGLTIANTTNILLTKVDFIKTFFDNATNLNDFRDCSIDKSSLSTCSFTLRGNSIVRNSFLNNSTINIDSGNAVIENNKIYNGGAYPYGVVKISIQGNYNSTLLIRNNEFVNSDFYLKYYRDYYPQISIINNTFYNSIVSVQTDPAVPTARVYFVNNIIPTLYYSQFASFWTEPPKEFKNNLTGKTFYSGYPINYPTDPLANNFSFPPGFKDVSKYDFTLEDWSQAIGRGLAEFTPPSEGHLYSNVIPMYDLTGKVRPTPTGTNLDLGAYENSLSAPTTSVTITSIKAGIKRDTINWYIYPNDTTAIRKYKLYRSTKPNADTLIAANINKSAISYTDSIYLQKGVTYYYRISAVDSLNNETPFSNEKTVTIPSNVKPTCGSLTNVVSAIGRKTEMPVSLSSTGAKDPDGLIDSTIWFINGVRIGTGSYIETVLKLGTNRVGYYVYDDDGAYDSVFTTYTYYAAKTVTSTTTNSGLSAFNKNNLFYSDVVSGYNSILRSDSLLQPNFSGGPYQLTVNNSIISSPSVTSDSIMFIPNGSSVDAYKINGTPWFSSSAALSGVVQVIPTVDTVLKRIYLGLSNGVWTSINYSTHTPTTAWNFFTGQGGGFSSPGVITVDRKLVFTTISGQIMGFDLNSLNDSNPFTKWYFAIGTQVKKPLSVDAYGNIVIVDEGGILHKYKLSNDGSVSELWQRKLNGDLFNTSVVIDAMNNFYCGTSNGNLIKLNGSTGSVIWSYSSNAAIKSTPALSGYNRVYFGNDNGEVHALNTETGTKEWYFKASSPIVSHLMHLNGATYFTTSTTKEIFELWDKPQDVPYLRTERTATTPVLQPIWSSFQGDYKRTGQAQTPSTNVAISGKVYLQGAFNASTGAMNNSLSASTILQTYALAQPYNAAYGYAGLESVSTTFLNAHSDIVDWVLLELRDTSSPSTIISTRAAFVKQDGTLLDIDGSSSITFQGVVPTSYYISIRHRNHLGIRSSTAVDFSSGSGSYDFTTSADKAYQNQSYTSAVQIGNIWAMRAGNANSNNNVKYNGPGNDQNQVLNVKLAGSLSQIITNAYSPEDLNMDGTIKWNGPNNDQNFLLNVILGGSLSTVYNEQL